MTAPDPALSPDLVVTDTAKEMLTRPRFPAFENSSGRFKRVLGGHVAVNGYDLARVEKDAYERGRLDHVREQVTRVVPPEASDDRRA